MLAMTRQSAGDHPPPHPTPLILVHVYAKASGGGGLLSEHLVGAEADLALRVAGPEGRY